MTVSESHILFRVTVASVVTVSILSTVLASNTFDLIVEPVGNSIELQTEFQSLIQR